MQSVSHVAFLRLSFRSRWTFCSGTALLIFDQKNRSSYSPFPPKPQCLNFLLAFTLTPWWRILSLIQMPSNDNAGRIHMTSFKVCINAVIVPRVRRQIYSFQTIKLGHDYNTLYHRLIFRHWSNCDSISLSKATFSWRCLFIFWDFVLMRLYGFALGNLQINVFERSCHHTFSHNGTAAKLSVIDISISQI